ncbi:unnamed protein product [Peronospora belbahrii]|uniref:Uncharacterized protein n=1 Tax=Peronospora belbahrii TaxID=622444 RepID=A0AAU9KS15_9STRA|nr:unnamed protein product [Peronospora belbahrii]
MCDSWEKPHDASSLRELEQLRVLSMYEFDPPLSSQELLRALRTCGNRTEDAYQYLKVCHRHQHSIAMPTSTSIATASNSMGKHERAKRSLSASPVDNSSTPKKRQKDQSFALIESQEQNKEEDEQCNSKTTFVIQNEKELVLISPDDTRVQQLLLETVEDRVVARQPSRKPEWINDLWKCLQASPVHEIAIQLNVTVDALAKWVKEVESQQDAHDIQTRGVVLTGEVVASQPREVEITDETIAYSLDDCMISASDEEAIAIVQAHTDALSLSAIARANAAKHAIECLSAACKTYMDRLSQLSFSNETSCREKAETEASLEALNQKLNSLVDESTVDVTNTERALSDAKETKETLSLQIAQCVRERHEELVAAGETDASASIQSVIEIWKQDNSEVQALWSSRSESDRQVEKTTHALRVAQHALTFYKSLSVLFCKVRERREKALSKTFEGLEEARASSVACATTALEKTIPTLARALCTYYEFHTVQQLKAKKELEEQEKALEVHNEYFGDSAPIKKDDIERRIREFIGVTQSSVQVVMEIAEGQQQLWENKHAVLSDSARGVLIREFKDLWLQLSGPMQSVVKKFVTTIEEITGGAVAVEPHCAQKLQQPTSPVFTTTIALDEQVFPAFTIPAFPISHTEALTPYRTAISAISASNQVSSTTGLPISNKERNSTSNSMTMSLANYALTDSDQTMVSSTLPQETLIEPHKSRHKYPVDSVLYSKVTVDKNCTQFVRGVVVKHLDNEMYLMQYDNGDKYSVGSSFLFTKDLMEENVKAGDTRATCQDTEMEDVEQESSGGTCVIM